MLQLRGGQAVHHGGFPVDGPLGVDVAVKDLAGDAAINDRHCGHLDEAMAFFRLETCGFGVQDDETHAVYPV